MQGYHLEAAPPVTKNGTGTDFQLVGPNMKRHSLVIGTNCPNVASWASVSPGVSNPGGNVGFFFGSGMDTLILHYDDVGPLIYQPWGVSFGIAGVSVTVIETFWVKDS